jgi:hypothetical protein
MPELQLTESQRERFDALQEELAAEHAGSYASVRQQDVVDYLLDLAEEVDDPGRRLEPENDSPAGSTETDARDDDGPADESPAGSTTTAGETVGGGSDSSGESLASDGSRSAKTVTTEGGTSDVTTGGPGGMLNLLERHDDKWREGSGEERYEVELEDGTVETARTKDDVKAILFRHY